MLRVRFTVEGEVIIDRLLDGIEERGKDMTPAWPALVKVFRELVARAFTTEGASTAEPWPALAERTQRDRLAKGYGPEHPILQRTKRLMRSLVVGEGGFTVMTPESVEIGSDVDYFKYHQSNRPRKRLPRRAPALFTADQRHELMRPIRLYLTGRDPDAPQRSRVA